MQNHKSYLNQKGVTLIELLMTIAISAFIFTIVFALFKEGLVSYDRTVTEADSQLEVKYIHDVIKQDILNSKNGLLESIQYPKVEDNQLMLYIGTKTESKMIKYFLDGDSLFRKVADNPEEEMMKSVSSFHVVVKSDNLVKVSIIKNLSSPYSMQAIEKSFYVQAKPRGKF